jgi:hypothetical protein
MEDMDPCQNKYVKWRKSCDVYSRKYKLVYGDRWSEITWGKMVQGDEEIL